MMNRKLSIFFLFCVSTAFAQDRESLELTEQYFKGQVRRYKSLLTGEARNQNFDPHQIPKDAWLTFETLQSESSKSVIAVSIISQETTLDLYVFWEKKSAWQINAFRALALPGFFYKILDEYKGLDDDGLRKEYANRKKNQGTMPDSLMGSLSGSRDDFLFEVNNMRLMVASDKKLIEHFNTVKSKLDSILLITKALAASKKGHWTFDQKSELKTALQNVLVSYVTNGDGAIITFQIGGMIDNSVGYFYCENPSAVPKMTNNGFIMIRELAQGWYLFKTT